MEVREQLSLQKYLEQLDQPQVAFAVKQRMPKSLDKAVTATLGMESYALPEKMAKLGFASVNEPTEPEMSVAAVSHQNVSTAEVLERLLKHNYGKTRCECREAIRARMKKVERTSKSVDRWRGRK